jgi:hypothetical protein
MYTGFWWGNLRVRDHLEDTGVAGRIILIFRFFIPVVFCANEGGWVRQNTTVAGSYLLVR